VRTGYLSRYNYLSKPYKLSSIEELEQATIKGEHEQVDWIERCSPDLYGFKKKDWQECISADKNPHFASCRELLMKNIKNDEFFEKAYTKSAENYALKRGTNKENGFLYLVEENAWILTLPQHLIIFVCRL
jgi:hypothetical protein